ncbi:AbrB/MazE/SpoVT family DNA-binding domain-containing protein [Pseudalkalibacillus caeni]|uniref:AbrB/MazE/SpoVT family DNA-binding domain-containing protein n=1 Tax=Exobacillus caeni TaxID=2574798 RepID=A0A5R9F5V6_9BACL|nr:AbrB/MazE/SpoVT family DNA-binding domain-containing protein [Pseudalkalibacillus caeni]TLS37018.1 AbrB/MazE/SpoVT family DNA-binding domain-containing protein [Pseudalkalibacillus caeni]
MKSTGMIRKLDGLGRIVIPMELRRTLNIFEKDPLEIFTEGERIILKKYKAGQQCQLTGEVSDDNLVIGNGKLVLSRKAALEVLEEIESALSKQ